MNLNESIETNYIKYFFYKYINRFLIIFYPIKFFINFNKIDYNQVKTICILSQWGIGDSIQTSIILNSLLNSLPNCNFIIAGKENHKSLYTTDPRVSHLRLEPPWVKKNCKYNVINFYNFFRTLTQNKKKFDLIISNRFDIRDSLQVIALRPKYAYVYKQSGFNFLFANGSLKTYEQYLQNSIYRESIILVSDVLKAFKIYPKKNFFIQKNKIYSEKKDIAIIHPGGTDKDRHLCLDCNKKFIFDLVRDCIVYVVVDKDYNNEELYLLLKKEKILYKEWKGSLIELKRLIDKCSIFIGTDSGPLHMALTSSKSSVGFYISHAKKIRWFTNIFNKNSFATFMHYKSCKYASKDYKKSFIIKNDREKFLVRIKK